MRVLRFFSLLTVSLVAMATVAVPAAVGSTSPWAKGGEPTCTITVTSVSSSSTTCTGTLRTGTSGQLESANVDVDGVVGYQCQDASGATVPGQNASGGTGTQTDFLTSKKATQFTTAPTDLSAQTILSGSGAGCAGGFTVVDPTLTTFRVTLTISVPGTGASTFLVCAASDPNGLSGTIALTC